jgi:hypothetical protein
MRKLFLSILMSIGAFLPIARINAADTLTNEQQTSIRKALAQATFANSPPTADGASYIADPRIPQIPSFSYTKGTPLTQAIPAAVVMLMGADKYTPQTATQASGGDPTTLVNAKLTSLPFVGKLPFAATIAANPLLKGLKVGDVFPTWAGSPTNPADPNATLGNIAKSPLGKLPIPAEVLANTPIANLPGILTTPYNDYPGIGKPDLPGIPSIDLSAVTLGADGIKVGDLPGIPALPWSKLIKIDSIPNTLMVMKFDKLNSGQNKISVANGSKIASGSNKEPNAPCSGICDAVELLNAVDRQNNLDPYNGSLSIIGQRLKGGYGLLGDLMTAAGVREPAGFEVPYIGMNGCGSKWSAESPNAEAGTIRQQLNLRFCYSDILGFQATPYFIPLPLPLPTSEKQANLLIPMSISPVVIVKPPTSSIPTIPSTIAGLPSTGASPTPGDSKEPFTVPSTTGFDKVALFGSATKKAYSPTLGISSENAQIITKTKAA